MTHEPNYDFDIAISFAGEDRDAAEELASGLQQLGVRVFYDRYEQAKLWGKDLYQHLQSVYRDRAKYCVVFISTSYAQKLWPRHELRQAQERAFRESREYILPVKVDDTELPGLNATVGYIDLREHTIASVRDLVLRKLYGDDHAVVATELRPPVRRLRPPVRHSDPPPWYELSEDLFEDLCCDVQGLSPHIERAGRYGTRGETQKGVDIIGDRADGKREAAQCKCYRQFTKAVLDGAIKKFKENIDHWKERSVVSFRIYAASVVRSTKILDALHIYQEEFRVLGLELELCDGLDLSRTLIPYRSIVSKYLDPHWIDIICGPLQPTSPADIGHHLRGLEIQLDLGATELGTRQ